jgi:anti-sigma regulatory factor (Ser/Thr protein kinase)
VPRSSISIPPAAEHVRAVRLVAGAAARRGNVPESLVDEVRLAVGEAVARAVLRHRRAEVSADVVVTLHDDPEAFEVQIDDRAPADLPDTDDGMAEALVTALVPHTATTQIAGGGRRVRLVWPLEDPAQPEE